MRLADPGALVGELQAAALGVDLDHDLVCDYGAALFDGNVRDLAFHLGGNARFGLREQLAGRLDPLDEIAGFHRGDQHGRSLDYGCGLLFVAAAQLRMVYLEVEAWQEACRLRDAFDVLGRGTREFSMAEGEVRACSDTSLKEIERAREALLVLAGRVAP